MERSTEEKLLGGFLHLGLLWNWVGLIFAVVIFLIYREGKSPFVTAHAKQALGFGVVSAVVDTILGTLGAGSSIFSTVSGAGLGSLLSLSVLFLVALVWAVIFIVLVIWGAIRGFSGKEFRYPVIGEKVDSLGR